MFFIISKIVTGLFMPLSIIVALFFLSILVKNASIRKIAFRSALILLILFTNEYLANVVMSKWEYQYVSSNDIEHYEIGIVLTGIAKPSRVPYDRPEFNKGADRLLHAIRLYNQGKLKKILITGGKASLRGEDITPESHLLKEAAISFGVCSEDIILEDNANNTYENALYSAEILRRPIFRNKPVLLITSAFHMRRAIGCFEKQGVFCDVFPTDYYTSTINVNPFNNFYPSPGALQIWNVLFKEIIGITVYAIKGYL